MVMIPRRALSALSLALSRFPAVLLLGPRQIGKSTLAHQLASSAASATYLDLELPSDRAKLADPELYFQHHHDDLLLLDEIQRVPELFPILRGIIDSRRRAGRRTAQFLLLGSAGIALLQQTSESLAGRITSVELHPLDHLEVPDFDRLWLRGGFPESYLAADDHGSLLWRTAFLRTYLERDLPALGPRVPAETLHRFWQMLAHSQGQLLNAARLAGSLGVSGQTVTRYLDTLVDLLLVRRLQPWHTNAGKRLVRAPKIYVRDSGIVHALLGIPDLESLLGHPVAGSSWEGLLIENIAAVMPDRTQLWFYRTANGAEIDLILQFPSAELWAIAIKRSLAHPAPSKGFHLGAEDIGATRRIILYPGATSYPYDRHTEVRSLLDFLQQLASTNPDPRP